MLYDYYKNDLTVEIISEKKYNKEEVIYVKKLYKLRKDKKICGVCGGLAGYLEIDPTIVRLIVFLLILSSVGTGLIIYFAAALIMPYGEDTQE